MILASRKVWSPDTCSCVFNISVDDSTGKVSFLDDGYNICNHHNSLTPVKAYQAVLEENRRKNNVYGVIANTILSDVVVTTVVSDEFLQKLFEKTLMESLSRELEQIYTWSFDEHRNIRISLKSFSTLSVNGEIVRVELTKLPTIQSKIKNLFGNKVVFT